MGSLVRKRYPSMSEARLRMLSQSGHLYAVYSRYCDWIKIGFTLSLDKRLEAIARQYAEFAPFSLIGSTRSTWNAEQQLHRILAPLRQGQTGRTKELYPAAPSVVVCIKKIVACVEWDGLERDERWELSQWARRAAKSPLNKIEAELCFERFYAERRAA